MSKTTNNKEDLASNYINMFNSICKQVGNHLLSKFPTDKSFNIYNEILNEFIKIKPQEPISIFIKKVYAKDEYRSSIVSMNDDFFTNSSHDHLTKNKESRVEALFHFKYCWGILNDESKNFIKQAMKTLVDICEIYILYKSEQNKK